MIDVEVENDSSGFVNTYLLIDGIRQEGGYVRPVKEGFELSAHEDALINKLMRRVVRDFTPVIRVVHLYTNLRLIKGEQHISQHLILHKEADYSRIAFHFLFDVENWKRLWSVSEYQHEFRRIFDEQNLTDARWATGRELRIADVMNPSTRIVLSCPLDADTTIESESWKYSGLLTRLHELTESSLIAKLRKDSVVMQFDFPEEVRVPCEQYLLYFVQFLKDLGVEAIAELQHEAGQVLFAITPTDKDEALDKIRLALETYLRLSASPINESSINDEIAIQRLKAEIQGLQSRLTLARAEIQYKDKAIDAMQFIIDRQRLSGDVMMESLKNVTPKPPDKDKEAVLGGIVEITKYEGKGINVNFAELFRRLKEYLAKKK